jgi:hypothetical protein
MKRTLLAASVLAWLLSTQAQQSTESQAGDIIFQMPAGWQRADRGDKTFLSPHFTGTAASTYFQLEGFDLGNNSLQAGFQAGWQGFQNRPGFRSGGPTRTEHSPNGFDYLYATGAFQEAGKQWVVSLIAAQYGQRIETVLLLTSEPQALNTLYQKPVADFLASIHFGPSITAGGNAGAATNGGPPQVPPAGARPAVAAPRTMERDPAMPAAGPMSKNQLPTVPGKFSGIFRAEAREGIDPTAMLEDFSPAKRTANYQFLVLFSDGTAMRGLPTMGLDDYIGSVRLEIAGGGKPCSKWGVYRMSGNQGRVVFASPTAAGQQLVSGRLVGDTWSIQEYADHLDINGSSYSLLDGGPLGMKLEGTYKPYGDPTQPGITFTRDGEFIDQGIMKAGATAVGVIGGGFAIGYAFSSPGPGRGTYHVSNYTLHLTYANSQAPGVLFWIGPEASRSDARTIYIDNVKFVRVP